MRLVPQSLNNAWRSGDFTGSQRAAARVLLSHNVMQHFDTASGRFSSLLFNQANAPVELVNVRSVDWDRSADLEIASCTITLWNTQPLPLGVNPPGNWLDLPGYYSPKLPPGAQTSSYGSAVSSLSHGGYGIWIPNGTQPYQRAPFDIEPDMVLQTYEGYGMNTNVAADADPFLVRTGVWLIDKVVFGADGLITITCRDIGRPLVEEIAFPPVIPLARYPISFTSYVTAPPTTVTEKVPLHYHGDSSSNNVQRGHHASEAVDGTILNYWLSEAHATATDRCWYEVTLPHSTVSGVTLVPWIGHFKIYLSLQVNGKWVGPSKLGTLPVFITVTCGGETTLNLKFSRSIPNVTAIRVTLTQLADYAKTKYGAGVTPGREFRGGLRDLSAYRFAAKPGVRSGNYGDYSDIVKILASIGGLYWPPNATVWSHGAKATLAPAVADPVLSSGRCWGDFMATGTSGPVAIPASIFDKKPLLDGITYVRDVIGFNFNIDEDGGVVWRLPNWWDVGCYVQGLGYRPGVVHSLDDTTVIRKLDVALESTSQRSHFFVANPDSTAGAVTHGFDDNPAGLERVAVYEDVHFADPVQCRITADILAIRSYFTFRQDQIVISGNPAVQVDDQAQLSEAVTNEHYLHYIAGVKSTNDLQSGRYEMTLTTKWLGNSPLKQWAFAPSRLAPETKSWLLGLGVHL